MTSDDESPEDVLDAEAFRSLVDGKLAEAVRRQWVIWVIRLVIGIVAVAATITAWPHLWWLALAYAPFPVFSALVIRRVGRQVGRPEGLDVDE
tara:strand:- start:244063 stop:244341 length:279 start_codon:yes stop_codon:yes gene_type:complete